MTLAEHTVSKVERHISNKKSNFKTLRMEQKRSRAGTCQRMRPTGVFRKHKAAKLFCTCQIQTQNHVRTKTTATTVNLTWPQYTFGLYFRNLPRKTGFSTVEVNANFLFPIEIRSNFNLSALRLSKNSISISLADNAPRNDVCSEREGKGRFNKYKRETRFRG